MSSNQLNSYLYLALAQVVIGVNIVTVKYLIPVIPIFLLFTIRFMLGSLLMAVICYLRKTNPLRDSDGQSLLIIDWLVIFAQAMCAGFLFNTLIVSGLRYTEANTAGVIASLTPVVIAILSYFFLKEALGPRRIIAIILAVIGVIIINLGKHVEGEGLSTWFGNMLVLISVFPEALFTIIAKWYKKELDSYALTLLINVFNFLMFMPLAITSMIHVNLDLSFFHIILILFYSVLGGAVFFVFWYKGLAKSSASVAAIFTAVMPISASIFAYIFLGETVTRYDLVGIVLVILSIVFGAMNMKSLTLKTLLFND